MINVLVCSGYCDKISQAMWLKSQKFMFSLSEGEPIQFLVRALFLDWRDRNRNRWRKGEREKQKESTLVSLF